MAKSADSLHESAKRKRVAFVDADPLLFDSIRSLLLDLNLVAVRSLTADATKLDQIEALVPDIILMEYDGRIEEIEALVDQLDNKVRTMPMVLMRVPPEQVHDLKRLCSSHALLGRNVTPEEFSRAMNIVSLGGNFIDPVLIDECPEDNDADQTAASGAAKDDEDDPLSEREQAVLYQIALGHYSKEIAANLDVSTKTVETYKTRAMKKLRLGDRTAVVRYAVVNGWFEKLAAKSKVT